MQAVARTLRWSRPSLFQSPLSPAPSERSLWFSFANSASQLQALSSLTDRKADDEGSGEGEGDDEDPVEVREEDDQFSLRVGSIDGSSNACKLKLTTNHHHLLCRMLEAQSGFFWFCSTSRPSFRHQSGVCNMSTTSANWENRRGEWRNREECAEIARDRCSSRQSKDTKAADLELYMKSRYDPESLEGSEEDDETPSHDTESLDKESEDEESEDEEETPTDPDHVEEDDKLDVEEFGDLKPNGDGKFENVMSVLADPYVLEAAYKRLKIRQKNWTLGNDELEVSHLPKDSRIVHSQDINWTWFEVAAEQLWSGSFPFKPVRQVEIVRRRRGEPKHFLVVNSKDQVVQEAIRGILLSRIYEPNFFTKYSHGFGPGNCVHSALKSIKYGWRGVSWFLQFDVRKADDSLVQNRLMRILGDRIQDPLFLNTIRQMFAVGIISVDIFTGEKLIPQGSVLSPVLGNIYFHQLDLEIDRIIEEVNREENSGDLTQRT